MYNSSTDSIRIGPLTYLCTVPFQSIQPVTHHRAQFWSEFAPWSPVTGAAVGWALRAPTPSWSRYRTMSRSLGPAVEPARQNARVTGHTPGRIDRNGTVHVCPIWPWPRSISAGVYPLCTGFIPSAQVFIPSGRVLIPSAQVFIPTPRPLIPSACTATLIWSCYRPLTRQADNLMRHIVRSYSLQYGS